MDTGFFAGREVLVMGLGRFGGGVDAAKFAAEAGAKLIVTDLASSEQLAESVRQLDGIPAIEYHLGAHDPKDFERADIVIANPAVAWENEFLEIARRHNSLVTTQINIFFELCPATIIGITGANGKSTTAALTAHLLRAAADTSLNTDTKYENIWLSGNIGNEPLLTLLDRISPNDIVVLELSSFQTEQLELLRKAPKVALLTNLTPNHLDRHGTFEAYCAAKENIFKLQELNENDPAVSIFNAEDPIACQWFEKYKSDAGRLCIRFSADDVSADIRQQFPLPGRANLSNLAAALAVAGLFDIDDQTMQSCLSQFKALTHRLEFIAEINGVRWYNDSIATTPQSAIAALDAFEEPKIIIAGGYDKNIGFEELGRAIGRDAKAAILLGQTAGKIAAAIEDGLATENTELTEKKVEVQIADSLAKAVESANHLAIKGDVVLLSPACASYDMFDNFQQRGREFVELVRQTGGRFRMARKDATETEKKRARPR